MQWSNLGCLVVLLLAGCQMTSEAEQEPGARTEQQRQVAMQAYRQGDYHLAQGLLQKLAAHPVSDPQAPCFLGAIHFRQHEYEAALKNLQTCRWHQPEQLEIWFNSAAIHLRLASELLLTGRSYALRDVSEQGSEVEQAYTQLLEAILRLQRLSGSEAARL